MGIVTSPSNPRVKSVKRLHTTRERRKTGHSIAEGPNALSTILGAGITPALVLRTIEDAQTASLVETHQLDSLVVSDRVLSAASDTQNPQGPIVAFPIPDRPDLRRNDTIVLVGISDPGNVGTIVRSAAAFGWDVAIAADTADPWSPKAIRSSASTVFGTPISRVDAPLVAAAELDMTTVATVVSGGEAAPLVLGPTVLLIGAEASGLSQNLVHGADICLTIPMPGGTESLNAAVAAAVAMHSIAARR